MGYNDTMLTLSNIHCGLAGFNNYLNNRSTGAGRISSALDAGANLCFGLMRNNIAYDLSENYGCTYAHNINSSYGYGSAEENAGAMMGLMSAFTPYMFFNSYNYCCRYPSYGTYSPPRTTHESYHDWHGHLVRVT